jgi:hypothetical protein
MGDREWAGLVAGLALAGAGLFAFILSGDDAGSAPAVESVETTLAPAVVETVLVGPQVEIPGLSDAADRVLSSRGYAGVENAASLGLPEAVVRVLKREGVVLLVPESSEGGGPAGGGEGP